MSLACNEIDFQFFGRSAHAAAAPHLGRSALDAVELVNVGVNYLREHMPPTARIHYALIDAGGMAPNVVQAHATVLPECPREPRRQTSTMGLCGWTWRGMWPVARGSITMTSCVRNGTKPSRR